MGDLAHENRMMRGRGPGGIGEPLRALADMVQVRGFGAAVAVKAAAVHDDIDQIIRHFGASSC